MAVLAHPKSGRTVKVGDKQAELYTSNGWEEAKPAKASTKAKSEEGAADESDTGGRKSTAGKAAKTG